MKLKGGYTPKIPGRPNSILKKVPMAPFLQIDLNRNGLLYEPSVRENSTVVPGDILMTASAGNDELRHIPSPAGGVVKYINDPSSGRTVSLKLTDIDPVLPVNADLIKEPGRISPDEIRAILSEKGIWDYIWSSGDRGVPGIAGEIKPKSIIINSIISEPFRARGKVLLKHFWRNIIKGMGFLNLLLEDYGTIQFILTSKKDPIVKMMLHDLLGKTNLKFHFVDVKYPIESNEILNRLLKGSKGGFQLRDEIWMMNIQSVEMLGNCLGNGIVPHRRIVAFGGPAYPEPIHYNVRIGTPLKHIIPESVDLSSTLVLKGGLFLGELVDPEKVSIGFDDDSFFFLPVKQTRDFIPFLRPGFNKRSIFPNFAGISDRDISDQLRGEERPCIACCKCEEVCPVDLLPQVLHRYLYRGNLDEAQSLGLNDCIGCNLCTYICPSKIELKTQFDEAGMQLRSEQESEK